MGAVIRTTYEQAKLSTERHFQREFFAIARSTRQNKQRRNNNVASVIKKLSGGVRKKTSE